LFSLLEIKYNFLGDGEHGKLGHGTTDRVRRPKLITGIKARGGKTIRDWHYVSAGFR
jgi:hypothetical protein